MNILVSDLRKFKELASHIRRQKNLEIDSFIRFGNGVIAKNAYESLIKFDCPSSDEDFLINEEDLYPLVAQTPSDIITVTNTKKGVIVSDGRDKFPALTTEFSHFLNIPDVPEKTTPIDADFLTALSKTWPVCATDENQGKEFYAYVHIGNECMCAGDGAVGFMAPITQPIKLALKRDVASIVSKYEFESFSESDAFQFFHAPGFVMGFRKTVVPFTDIRFAFKCTTDRTFTYSASDLKSFNTLFLKRSKTPVCTFENGSLTAYDMYLADKVQKRESPEITVPEEFSFNPEKTNRIIDSMGVETLDFHKGNNMYYVKSVDTKSIAIIARVKKL